MKYGPQGWWPLIELGSVHYQPGNKRYGGYHPNDYSFPKSEEQIFEICVGALLTQNTSWNQAARALLNLHDKKLLNPKLILSASESALHELIKPAGYFRQKTKKLKGFSKCFLELKGKTPKRKELLEAWGVGPETADSILLYAYNKPFFVVDAYTKRVFSRIGIVDKNATYHEIQKVAIKNLPEDSNLFNEYHALIVELAKNVCNKRSLCSTCPIEKVCEKNM